MKIKTKALWVFVFALFSSSTHARNTDDVLNITSQELDQAAPSTLSAHTITKEFNETAVLKAQSNDEQHFHDTLAAYIGEHYNKAGYTEFLSQNADHFNHLTSMLAQLDLGESKSIHAYTILKLFNDKMKGCELIDDSTTAHIITSIHEHLGTLFKKENQKHAFATMKEDIELQLNATLLDAFDDFAMRPEQTLAQIATHIATEQTKRLEAFEYTLKLKHLVVRFVDGLLQKTIWNRVEHHGVWHSVVQLSHAISKLGELIEDEDDTDSLLWSLTHRFCFFLSLTGSSLPLSFYEHIEEDLISGVIPFLEAEEQDDVIKKKKTIFAERLMQAKTQALAFTKSGILSEQSF